VSHINEVVNSRSEGLIIGMTPSTSRGVDSLGVSPGIEDDMDNPRVPASSISVPATLAPPVTSATSAPAPAPAVGVPSSQTQLDQLLQILVMQQARLAQKDQEIENQRQARDTQREKNAQDHTAKDLLRQARCTHLKGGRKGPRSQVRDYAIYLHTFIDRHYEIRCFLCKMIWKVNDTVEFLVRRGKKIPNHTKLGWSEAAKMLEQTTNTPSSSEIPLQIEMATTPANE